MTQDKAERGIRSFAGDWRASRAKEAYTSEDVEDCRAELSAQRPELLEFHAAGREELMRAGIEEALEREGRFPIAISLEYVYAAVLAGCVRYGVNLRPVQAPDFDRDLAGLRDLLEAGPPTTWSELKDRSSALNRQRTNRALMQAAYPVLNDLHTGLNALGLAAFKPNLSPADERSFAQLPAPPMPGHLDDKERRLALLELWIADAVRRRAPYLPTTPSGWLDSRAGAVIRRDKGTFPEMVKDWVPTTARAPGTGAPLGAAARSRLSAVREPEEEGMRAGCGAAVLVSGGAGYLGSHVVLALAEAGYRAVVVDDLSRGHREAVPAGVELAVADAGDRRVVGELIERHGIAAAIHLADAGGVDEPAARIASGAASGAAFVDACAARGVRHLVLTSSAAAHGAGAGPASAYGAAKLATEGRVRAAFAAPGRGYAVLRCFNVAGADPALRAGPRKGRGLVQAACEAALGLREGITVFGTDWDTADGTCVRDYVHPCDVAAAHVAALRALECGADELTADCGTGCGHSVREVLAAVERASGASLAIREGRRRRGDIATAVAAPERIGRLPGWRARQGSLDTAVSTALAWTEVLARPAGRHLRGGGTR